MNYQVQILLPRNEYNVKENWVVRLETADRAEAEKAIQTVKSVGKKARLVVVAEIVE
jgi:hypothetical protein